MQKMLDCVGLQLWVERCLMFLWVFLVSGNSTSPWRDFSQRGGRWKIRLDDWDNAVEKHFASDLCGAYGKRLTHRGVIRNLGHFILWSSFVSDSLNCKPGIQWLFFACLCKIPAQHPDVVSVSVISIGFNEPQLQFSSYLLSHKVSIQNYVKKKVCEIWVFSFDSLTPVCMAV